MYEFDPTKYKNELIGILTDIKDIEDFNIEKYRKVLKKYPKDSKYMFSKNDLVRGYEYLLKNELISKNDLISERIQMKPTRTISGVVPVTVLTKPFHCPGECIFCPLEKNMPKSYLRDEPGAQRAERNLFSPYMQVYNRLLAFKNIGHKTEKVELIVLGGTWSYYPVHYQIWFVKEMFRALNDFGVKEAQKEFEPKGAAVKNRELFEKQLEEEQKKNELSTSRCVGLSIETRPDFVTENEVVRLRKLGCTKIQIGIQSMDDKVLEMNKRGHDHRASINAANTLRRAGFKVQVHYMPNLYGSTPEIDIHGYKFMFEDNNVNPDELKLYPTSIIPNTELYEIYKQGQYTPYNDKELLEVLTESIGATPEYTRLTRIIRDIPSTYIVDGNKKTNFREEAERILKEKNIVMKDIRAREIKDGKFDPSELELKIINYETEVSHEKFLQFVTKENKIVGFLRLSFPKDKLNHFIDELKDSAIIREIHVYGKSLNIQEESGDKAQHLGLGTRLINEAVKLSKENNFAKISVISAIGTREYYRKKGFSDGELYQYIKL